MSSNCQIKTSQSVKRKTFLRIARIVFRRAYALYVRFKMRPLRKSVLKIQNFLKKSKAAKLLTPESVVRNAFVAYSVTKSELCCLVLALMSDFCRSHTKLKALSLDSILIP